MLPTERITARETEFHKTIRGIVNCGAFIAIHSITALSFAKKSRSALLTTNVFTVFTIKGCTAWTTKFSQANPTHCYISAIMACGIVTHITRARVIAVRTVSRFANLANVWGHFSTMLFAKVASAFIATKLLDTVAPSTKRNPRKV